MSNDFRIEGLDKQLEMLLRASKDRKKYDELRLAVGNKHLENLAETAIDHEKSGRLIDSYRKIAYKGNREWILFIDGKESIEAGTQVFYARMVEEGHKLVIRRKTKTGKKGRKVVKGFVTGKHLAARALKQTEKDIPRMVEDFLRQLGKEAGFDVT